MKAIDRIETNENFNLIKSDALERFKDDKYKYECLAILLALDTGLRVSDLLKLNIDSIKYNSELGAYECTSSIIKTKVNNHKTLISSEVFKCLESINITGVIFINPKTNNPFTREWLTKRTNKRYGFSFHNLRKISAKRLLEVGTIMDAQRHLGHKRISSTDAYLKVSEKHSLERLKGLYGY